MFSIFIFCKPFCSICHAISMASSNSFPSSNIHEANIFPSILHNLNGFKLIDGFSGHTPYRRNVPLRAERTKELFWLDMQKKSKIFLVRAVTQSFRAVTQSFRAVTPPKFISLKSFLSTICQN